MLTKVIRATRAAGLAASVNGLLQVECQVLFLMMREVF
jgi:hypothetical protein